MVDEPIHPIRELLRFPKVRGPRPIADLMRETPLRIATSTIRNHVAVISLAHPLPSTGRVVRRALLREARHLVRDQPDSGPVSSLEVWAPLTLGGRLALVLRVRFEEPLGVPVSALVYGRGFRRYVIARSSHPSALPGEPPRAAAGLVGSGNGATIASSLRVPPPVLAGLAELHVDVADPLPRFVEALLTEAGFTTMRIAEAERVVDLEAERGGAVVFVRCYPADGERVPMHAVERFGCAFEASAYDEGVFVSDGPMPYGSQHWQRDPRIHLVGRVRMQQLVDAVASRLIRASVDTPDPSMGG